MEREPRAPLERASAMWAGASPRARVAAILAGLTLVAAAALLASLSRDTEAPLFAAPLAAPQVAEVGERLAAWGVPFRATADNLDVPDALRRSTLLRLAAAGIPHRPLPTSLEALADAGPLVPERVLEARQRAGLEGEVAQGLRTLDGVADATVIIAPGHEATFPDQSSAPTTASVRLSLRPGERWERRRVRAVRAFVAASVAGLTPEHVQVLGDGRLAADEEPADATTLQAQLQSALDRVEGEGRTLVRVRIVRDDDVREVLRRSVVPAGGSVRSRSTQEAYRSSGASYQGSSAEVSAGSDEREERTLLPAGRMQRVSVAVFVDRRRGGDVAKIRALVEAAIGFDVHRGDEVRVEALDFAGAHSSLPSSPWPLLLLALARPLAIAAAVAGGSWAALPLARAAAESLRSLALRRAVERSGPALDDAQRLRAALDVEPPHAVAAVISALPASTAVAVLDLYPPEERERIVRRMATARADAVPPLESILGKRS